MRYGKKPAGWPPTEYPLGASWPASWPGLAGRPFGKSQELDRVTFGIQAGTPRTETWRFYQLRAQDLLKSTS